MEVAKVLTFGLVDPPRSMPATARLRRWPSELQAAACQPYTDACLWPLTLTHWHTENRVAHNQEEFHPKLRPPCGERFGL